MKIYGNINVQEGTGTKITNLVLDSGTSDPGSPNTGELFYRTDLSSLRVYNGSVWTTAAQGLWEVSGSDIYYNAGEVGIGTSSPLLKLHIHSASVSGGPATSGTTPTGYAIIGSTFNNNLYFGSYGTSPYGAWIQAQDSSNLATTYALLLNPTGGNIGIGDSNPARQLTVTNAGNSIALLKAGNTSDSTIFFGDTDSTTVGELTYAHNINAFKFFTNATERMRIDSSGNVGIGTSTIAFGAIDNGVLIKNSGAQVGIRVETTAGSTGQLEIYAESGVATIDARGNPVRFTNTTTELMRITASGYVGIGEITPVAPLHITHNSGDVIRLDRNTATIGSGNQISFRFLNSASAFKELSSINSVSDNTTNTTEAGHLRFYTMSGGTAAERMRIDSSGKVGIGKTPVEKLEVANAGTCRIFLNDTTNSVTAQLGSYSGGVLVGSSTNHAVIFRTNDLERMRISSTGYVGIGVTPSAWTTLNALDMGTYATYVGGLNGPSVECNIYYDGTWRYKQTAYAAEMFMNKADGIIYFGTAPSGTGGNAVTVTYHMKLNNDGGLTLGTPTGGSKGAGTLNATAVYDDNTLLTCYVPEAWLDNTVDFTFWDSELVSPSKVTSTVDPITGETSMLSTVPRQHFGAHKFAERLGGPEDPLDLDKWALHLRTKRHLTSFPNRTHWEHGKLTTGEWIQRLIEADEIEAVHIIEVHERLKAKEAEIVTLQQQVADLLARVTALEAV